MSGLNQNFIYELFENNAITEPTFALFLSDNDALLDVGPKVDAVMKDPSDLVYLTSKIGVSRWTEDITQVRVREADGNVSKHYSFAPYIAFTTFDQSCIGLPNDFFNQIIGLILIRNADAWWSDDSNAISVPTAADVSKLPALEFLYGDYWVQALPENYMIQQDDGTYKSCLWPAGPQFALGTTFLKGYYSVFEVGTSDGTSKFGFAPHASSSKRAMEFNPADAAAETIPETTGTILGDKAFFETDNPLPEPAAAYYLNSVLVISSLLTFALF